MRLVHNLTSERLRPRRDSFQRKMALQVLHSISQGGEEIFECTGDEEDQRILSEDKALDRMSHYRELVRAKTDPHIDPNSFVSTQSLSPSEAFEVFQGRKLFYSTHKTTHLKASYRDRIFL